MSTLNIILFPLLLLLIISLDEKQIYEEDLAKCMWPNSINNNSTKYCLSMTSSLESTGSFKGKCCQVTRIINRLYVYKLIYGEKWRSAACDALK